MTDSKVNKKPAFEADNFILYSTSACHLCDDALVILNDLHEQMSELAKEQNFLRHGERIYTVNVVDIAESDSLIDVYGPRIPVLVFPSTREELAWPFDIQAAYQFILPKLSFLK